jgi:hypothetical protein
MRLAPLEALKERDNMTWAFGGGEKGRGAACRYLEIKYKLDEGMLTPAAPEPAPAESKNPAFSGLFGPNPTQSDSIRPFGQPPA